MSVSQTQNFCFIVHSCNKIFSTSGNFICQGKGGVVSRSNRKSGQKFTNRNNLSLSQKHKACVRRHVYCPAVFWRSNKFVQRKVSVFDFLKNNVHYKELCNRSRRNNLIRIFFKKNAAVFSTSRSAATIGYGSGLSDSLRFKE